MPDSSVASRSAAATMSASVSSQCPPSCTHRPNRGCSVSSAWVPVWSSTSADAVMWPGTHSRRQRVGPGEQERQHGVPQRVLRGIGRPPTGQQLDGRLVQAHLRTSRPSVGTGSRGPDGSCRVADRDGAQRLPVGRQLELVAHQVGGEDGRSDPAAAHAAHRQRHQQGLHGGADRDGEHGVLGGGAAGVGIAVRTVGHHERDDEFGCVVEDLAAADAALDGVGGLSVAGQVGAPLLLHPVQQRDARCRGPASRRSAPAGCGAARAR